MKKLPGYLLTYLLVFILATANSFSQTRENIRPSLILQYVKINDKPALQARLTYSGENGDIPLAGKEIAFFAGGTSKLLGTLPTDENGKADFSFDTIRKSFADETGSWKFTSEFKGKDTIDAASAEISVRDITLGMTLTIIDTIKTVKIIAYTYERDKKTPLKGEVINVFVPRMFSNLTVADAKLDDNGTASIVFPSDIPGDKEGNLTIVARLTEHPVFGTVEKLVTEKWGVPTSYSVPAQHRALWTKTPPMWMIVTLSILLIGVWGHYMFAVISLVLIWIDAKRKKAKDEYKL